MSFSNVALNKIANFKKLLRNAYSLNALLKKKYDSVHEDKLSLTAENRKLYDMLSRKDLVEWKSYVEDSAVPNTMYLVLWPGMSYPVLAYYTLCMDDSLPEYNTYQFMYNGLPLRDQYSEHEPEYIIPVSDILPNEHKTRYHI